MTAPSPIRTVLEAVTWRSRRGRVCQLIAKALLALEEGALDHRDHVAHPNFAIRFALAYLYAVGEGERWIFDAYWAGYTGREGKAQTSAYLASVVSNGVVEAALNGMYRSVGLARTPTTVSAVHSALRARIGGEAAVPMGTRHTETGLLLHRDGGARWRPACEDSAKALLGCRVRVEGVRSGFDDVSTIERAD